MMHIYVFILIEITSR